MYEIKQSTAVTVQVFVHDENGDGVTGLTDGSFTKRISKGGSGAWAAMTVTITEGENGWYFLPLSTAHTNTLGILAITLTNAGAKQLNVQWRVEAKLIDDLNDFNAASDDVAVVTTVGTATNLTNLPSITAGWLTATGIAANALDGKGNWNVGKSGYTLTQSFPANFAAFGITVGGAVSNVIVTATCSVNSDMVGTDGALLAANVNVAAGVVESNLIQMGGVVQSGTDLKDFADAGYDPVTNKVEGVKTVDTTIANTDMVGTNGANTVVPDNAGIAANNAAIAALNDPTAAVIAFAVADEVLTGGSHNVPDSLGRRIRDLQEFGVYEGGSIWLDTVNGTPGTTLYESGTAFNPVNTMADVNTLLVASGLARVHVAPNSVVTLAAAQNNQTFIGQQWTLALGGQDIGGSLFAGATVSGIAIGTMPMFRECVIGTVTLPPCRLIACQYTSRTGGGITMGSAGEYFTDRCSSNIPGDLAPIFTWDGSGTSTLELRHYSGGAQYEGMIAGDLSSFEGNGQFIEGTCTGGEIHVRGMSSETGITNITVVRDEISQGVVDNGVAIAALNDFDSTLAMTESYAADGVEPSHEQCMYMILQILQDFNMTGTVVTTRKLDGVTTAMVHTHDDAANPTDRTRTG